MKAPSVVILIAAVLGIGAAAFVARRQNMRFQYYLAPSDPDLPRLAQSQGYALQGLDVTPGVKLHGLVRSPRGPSDPCLLLFPGNAEHQLSVSLPLLEALRAGGPAGGAIWSYRGFDGSSGRPSPAAAAADARAQAANLRASLGVEPARLVIVGFSMGSGIALRLASELARQGQPPAAVIMMSPYWTLELTPARTLGTLFPSETYAVQDVLPDVSFPLLIIAGARDSALPVEQHARRLVRALGPRATYWELPEAGHHEYLADASLMARVAAWARLR